MQVEHLGQVLRRLRSNKDLSLRHASTNANFSLTYLWQIEKGQRKPSADILKRLALVYDVTVEYLLEIAGYLETDEAIIVDTGEPSSLDESLANKDIQTILRGWGELSLAEKRQIANMVRFFLSERDKRRNEH